MTSKIEVISILIILLSISWLLYKRWWYSHIVLTGLDDCRRVDSNVCAWCGELVFDENYSGWDAFVINGYSQKLCVMCNGMDKPIQKVEG